MILNKHWGEKKKPQPKNTQQPSAEQDQDVIVIWI